MAKKCGCCGNMSEDTFKFDEIGKQNWTLKDIKWFEKHIKVGKPIVKKSVCGGVDIIAKERTGQICNDCIKDYFKQYFDEYGCLKKIEEPSTL